MVAWGKDLSDADLIRIAEDTERRHQCPTAWGIDLSDADLIRIYEDTMRRHLCPAQPKIVLPSLETQYAIAKDDWMVWCRQPRNLQEWRRFAAASTAYYSFMKFMVRRDVETFRQKKRLAGKIIKKYKKM